MAAAPEGLLSVLWKSHGTSTIRSDGIQEEENLVPTSSSNQERADGATYHV
ncbi:hypothetical protein J6590_080455 [Homalodisca vitripennis]|nr:hypothetical protein J6590_080455 [Homalodisca vitripennis]